jgi:hypothetical protein
MRSVYQPHAAIAQRCGRKQKESFNAEPLQDHCTQSVDRLFHVKRVALHPDVFVRRNPSYPISHRHSIQPDNFSFVTPLKHSPVYSGRR